MESGEFIAYRTVHCGRHGDNREAFMCKHLLEGTGLGFFSDSEDVSTPYPDAWCSECERVRGKASYFEDEYARATFKLVCGACYEEIRAKNVRDTEGSAQVQ